VVTVELWILRSNLDVIEALQKCLTGRTERNNDDCFVQVESTASISEWRNKHGPACSLLLAVSLITISTLQMEVIHSSETSTDFYLSWTITYMCGPPLWSSGQSSWLQIRRPGVRFPALPEKKVVVLEQGPLSLVSTTEELLDRKSSGSCL
jgi:hypothetical protein